MKKPLLLNLPFQIAKRLAFNQQNGFSKFIIQLSIAATALSVVAMILTTAFVNGFQKTVSEKVYSFWGNVRVQHYEADKSLVAEETPFKKNDSLVTIIKKNPLVASVQSFATKSVVIEKNRAIEGVLLKGIGRDYDTNRLVKYLSSGTSIHFNDTLYSKEILISESLSKLLNIKINDTVTVYFISKINNSKTYRKLTIAGLFKTGIEEYDRLFILGDIALIQRLNDWSMEEIGGYEIVLQSSSKSDLVNQQLAEILPYQWMSRTVHEIYPNIFDWLKIQDMNRNVIFTIMAIVAIINLISCLLILILERTRMVGVLKAVGATDGLIMKVFLYQATFITMMGIGLGLLLGLGIAYLQQYTGFIQLDESAYYVSKAPIQLIAWQVLAICLGMATVCFLSLTIPAMLIKKINPVKAIQFR